MPCKSDALKVAVFLYRLLASLCVLAQVKPLVATKIIIVKYVGVVSRDFTYIKKIQDMSKI